MEHFFYKQNSDVIDHLKENKKWWSHWNFYWSQQLLAMRVARLWKSIFDFFDMYAENKSGLTFSRAVKKEEKNPST